MWILFGTFLVLMALGAPIAFCLGISSVIWLIFVGQIPLVMIPQRFMSGLNSWIFLCVPFFMLAGNLMNEAGITRRLIKFANSFLGHIRGGLSLANVGVSMIFAGVSGTAVGDASSIGTVLIPAMIEEGYEPDFSAAVTAASSVVGPVIPPSLSMIVAAAMLNLSVGKMFMAGVLPGLLLGIGLMSVSYYISIKRNHPKEKKCPIKERLEATREALWALIMPIIIVGGIVGGIFTPTEAAGVACVYALIIGMFVYKTLRIKNLPRIFLKSLITTAPIMVLIGTAFCFAWILIAEEIPQQVSVVLLSLTDNKYLIMLLINIFLLFVGAFMETNAAILILFPVLIEIGNSLGIDSIHFTMFTLLNLMIGLTTPPLGVCLFIVSTISGISVIKVAKANWPFLLISLIVLLLTTYIPGISLWIPQLIYR
jgi:C4-dicarboxylate transporter, DctM subunit